VTPRPRVVIVGGGFAGLQAAKALGRAPVDVTVVDRANHHLFQPLLYQVATAALSPGEISKPIRSILRRRRNVRVLLGEATRVDLRGRAVELADGERLPFDYVALAPGSRHDYFGRPEWETLAPGLKTLEDAEEIRRRVLLAFERAERATTPEERQRELTFVVVGAGPTGVELAGALAEIKRFALRRDFRHIDPRDAAVLLLEGGPRVLPSYPPDLSDRAKEALRRLGVEVRPGAMVEAVEPGAVSAAGWRIPTATVIWAAGNVTSPLLQSLGVPLDRQGRVEVEPDGSVPGEPRVFVLGDAAAFAHDPRHHRLPGIAPVAMQQGRHAARVIRADLAGRPRPPFRYRDNGQLAVIGRGRAVADLGTLRLSGFVAWLAWVVIHIAYLIGFANRMVVLVRWAWSYLTFERGARLITREWRPGGGAAGPPP
jgi:NADH:ubiquinone reductase (H+-translocating)